MFAYLPQGGQPKSGSATGQIAIVLVEEGHWGCQSRQPANRSRPDARGVWAGSPQTTQAHSTTESTDKTRIRRPPPGPDASTVDQVGSFGVCQGDSRRVPSTSPSPSTGTRVCSSESRSRRVTVSSSIVWPSTVIPQGVPISSWRL